MRSPSRIPALIAAGFSATVVVVVIAVLYTTGVLGHSSTDANNRASTTVAADLTVHHSGAGWESSSVPDLSGRKLLFLTYDFSAGSAPLGSTIEIIDRASGALVGRINAGRSPLVAYRGTTGQLIVSDLPVDRTTGAPLAGSQQASPPYRILIFDIAANLDLLSTTDISASREGIELPSDLPDERGIFTVSDDQSYLYYVETVREQRGDRPVVDILDLTAAPRVTATVRLSSTNECDAFSLYPFGASSMIVNCSSYNSPKAPGAVMVLTPDGSLGDSIGAEGLAGTIPGTSRPWPVAGTFALPGNGIGLVYLNGAYAVYNGSAPTLAGRALPDDDLMYGAEGEVTTLDSSHVVLAYWPGPQLPQDPRQAAAGFSVFNTATGSIEKDSKVDNYGVYGISSHEVAIVKRESVELLDLDTMKTEWSLQTALPEHPDVLPRVRVAH